MTNPDYRAMCTELVDVVYEYCILHEGRDNLQPLVDRARALLAQPEPEGPTNDELLRLAREWNSGFESIELHFAADFARAALARYGRPTPQPVAVSERLPSAADCDAEGNCWWFDPHANGARYVDTFQSCYTYWLPASALPTPEAKP